MFGVVPGSLGRDCGNIRLLSIDVLGFLARDKVGVVA